MNGFTRRITLLGSLLFALSAPHVLAAPDTMPNADSKSVVEESAKVNINAATAEQLSALKGVGKAKADAIVEHRNEHGDFAEVEDITQVKGVGESILKANLPILVLE